MASLWIFSITVLWHKYLGFCGKIHLLWGFCIWFRLLWREMLPKDRHRAEFLCHNPQQVHHTSMCETLSACSQTRSGQMHTWFLVIVPTWKSKERCKRSTPLSYSVTNAMVRWCWKPGLFPVQQQSSVDVSVSWELPRGLQPMVLSSGFFLNHHCFSVAVCQLLTREQMEPCSSFVISGPVCRPDLLCLFSGTPEDFKSLTHRGEGTRTRELPSKPSQGGS